MTSLPLSVVAANNDLKRPAVVVDDDDNNEDESAAVPIKKLTPNEVHNSHSLQIKRVLQHDAAHKTLILHAKFSPDDSDAIVILEKTAFPVDPGELEISLRKQFVCKIINDSEKQHVLLTNEAAIGWQWSTVMHNDVYHKYGLCFTDSVGHVTTTATEQLDLSSMRATVIHPATQKHLDKYNQHHLHMVRETPQVYDCVTKPHFIECQFSLDWVYNILDGRAEMDRVVYQHEDFILMEDYKWDGKLLDELYCLAIVKNRELHSLRELRGKHLPILKAIFHDGRQAIEEKYKLEKSRLRCYFHYQPSFYHLHVHMVPIHSDRSGAFVGRAHLLQEVIDRLEENSDHYVNATLYYQLPDNDPLYNKLSAIDNVIH